MFKVGDIVTPLFTDNGGYNNLSTFKGELTVGNPYTVFESYIDNGDEVIEIKLDGGYSNTLYANPRFVLMSEYKPSQYSHIERKIRQIAEKRKSLGYRW